MKKIPSSQLARGGIVGSTAMKIGFGKLKTKAKRPFLTEQNKQKSDEQQLDAEADLLFKAITQLRGTAVKLAQMLGMETELLPDRIRDELSKSYHQVPPLNKVLVSKVILNEFGVRPETLFKSFDMNAIAAASLGQVHRAELGNGQQVAVKVQYPGIHVTIESDLKLLSKLATNLPKLSQKARHAKKEIIEASIAEIGDRLIDETNYVLEAENTQWFKQELNIEGVQVPAVYEDFSGERVITTELMDGKHLDDWLEGDPPQAARNKAAQLIYDAFVESSMDLGRLHADPNPGNYLFKPDGSIALIDFGCVKRLDRDFIENLPELLHAFSIADYEKIVAAYAKVGTTLQSGREQDYETVLKPFGEWLSLPFQEASFDFKENSNYTSSGFDLIHKLTEMPSIESVQEDFIFFDRTVYGLFKVFERMQATVFMRDKWEHRWDNSQ